MNTAARGFAAGVVFVLAVAASLVHVIDDGCPAGGDVEAALASMLAAPDTPPETRDAAKLQRRGARHRRREA